MPIATNLRDSVEELKKERDRIDALIEQLEAMISELPGGATRAARGRKKKKTRKVSSARAGKKTKATSKGKRKNAPRGLMKKLMHQVLRSAGKPLSPTVLRDRIIAAGYPARDRTVFYTAVYNAAKKDPAVKKTKAGFALRGRAASKA